MIEPVLIALGGLKSHDPLFFGCSFATQVWQEVKFSCGLRQTIGDPASEIQWGSQLCSRKSFKVSAYKLCCCHCSFHLAGEKWLYFTAARCGHICLGEENLFRMRLRHVLFLGESPCFCRESELLSGLGDSFYCFFPSPAEVLLVQGSLSFEFLSCVCKHLLLFFF